MTPLGPIVQSSDEVLNDSSEVVPYEKLMLAPLITPVRLDVRSTKKVYSKTNVEKQPHHATAQNQKVDISVRSGVRKMLEEIEREEREMEAKNLEPRPTMDINQGVGPKRSLQRSFENTLEASLGDLNIITMGKDTQDDGNTVVVKSKVKFINKP